MTNKMRPVEVAERLDKQALYPTIWHDGDEEALELAAEIVRKVDKGELVEVVHAEWIHTSEPNEDCMGGYHDVIQCSDCHEDYDFEYDYCPNCGAKMDGERKDGEENV
jgi:reverse gyrase